jgi:Transglutaminase-like superfamily
MMTRALHGIARISIRLLPPQRAFLVVRAVASFLPTVPDNAAITMEEGLGRSGTCLTRAMTVASRMRAGAVAIGVKAPSAPFRAHAWVLSREGHPLRESDRDGEVIAVLRPRV